MTQTHLTASKNVTISQIMGVYYNRVFFEPVAAAKTEVISASLIIKGALLLGSVYYINCNLNKSFIFSCCKVHNAK